MTQYLLFGGKIIELYLAALSRAGRWLHLPAGTGWWALALLVGLVGLVGGLGALAGRRVGLDSADRLGLDPTGGR